MGISLLDLVRAEDSSGFLGTYFGVTSDGYTGGKFDTLAGGGDRPETRNAITADDLVAVQMLSVTVPPATAVELMEGTIGRQLSEFLAQIPINVELGTRGAEMLVADCSPADQAWRLLNKQVGIRYVTAGKLLARKRPHLIPVYDQVIGCQFGEPKGVWLKLHCELAKNDGVLRAELARLRDRAGVSDAISLLRVLDVVLWMKHREQHRSGPSCPGFDTVLLR